MFSEEAVRGKSDAELVEIWTRQIDYVPELVAFVKSEIDRRKLDVDHIHVVTVMEAREESERASDGYFIVPMSIMQLLFAAMLAIFIVVELVDAHLRDFLDTRIYYELGAPVVACVFALSISVGTWKRRKWAFVLATIAYSLIFVWNVAATALAYYRYFSVGNGPLGYALLGMTWNICFIIISLGFGLSYNSLRRRSSVSVT